VVFLLPFAAAAALMPARWWPLLFPATVLTSALNAWYERAQIRQHEGAGTSLVSHTVLTSDPQLRDVAQEFGQGVGFVTLEGVLVSMTRTGMWAFGRSSIPAQTMLAELCVPDDAPRVRDAIVRACRAAHEIMLDVEVQAEDGARHRVRLGITNRLHDVVIRRLILTVRDVTRDTRAWQRLGQLADQAVATEVISAQEDERQRVAQELEDLQQVLALSHQSAGSGPALRSTVLRAVASMQQRLRPPALDHLGLEEALRHYTVAVADAAHRVPEIRSNLTARLDPALEVSAYRLTQDAMAMCQRAGLELTGIDLITHPDRLEVTVAATPAASGRIASFPGPSVTFLAARAHLVGGSVEIDSDATGPTSVVATLPIAAGPAETHIAAASRPGAGRGHGLAPRDHGPQSGGVVENTKQ
jgi:signal transduction histidine kinase